MRLHGNGRLIKHEVHGNERLGMKHGMHGME